MRARLVYATENLEDIRKVESVLTGFISSPLKSTSGSEETWMRLKDVEAIHGFMDWKALPENEYDVITTEFDVNVSPYCVRWEIIIDKLKRDVGIEYVGWGQ